MGEGRRIIGENIKKICSLKGISQVDIAKHMNVSQGTVSNWVKGTNSVDLDNLPKLCAFLGVSLDQIFGVAQFSPEVILSPEETELLGIYRALNKSGRSALLVAARGFAGNPDLQKEEAGYATA